MSYAYLASPYMHEDPFVMELRYLHVSKVLAARLLKREWTYSPIVHCHELAKTWSMPKHAAFWRAFDLAMLAKADSFIILRIDGWNESAGIAEEKFEAERLNIPVGYI